MNSQAPLSLRVLFVCLHGQNAMAIVKWTQGLEKRQGNLQERIPSIVSWLVLVRSACRNGEFD